MRKLTQFVLLTVLVCEPLSAAADKSDVTPEQVREIGARYAACVVGYSAAQTRNYLLGKGSPPIAGGCLTSATDENGGQMKFPGQNYRYVLADAMIKRDFPSALPAGVKTAPEWPHEAPKPLDEAKLPKNPDKAQVVRERFAKAQAVWLFDVIGDCVARDNPDAAYVLAKSAAGAPAERAAFATLKPVIGGCLPTNTTLRLDAAMLRGAIVLNLYRLAYSVRTPAHA